MTPPRILVFDSGLGGLTVLREIRLARPDAEIAYLADTAGFPYGRLNEAEVVRRVTAVMKRMIATFRPEIVVIACNTASTLVLPHLRAGFDVPFVGTVPAIKPAASATRSGVVAVLATPATVKRDYTRALIETYAYHVDVVLVGATELAGLAEAALRGERVDDEAIRREIAPAFVERFDRRTDTVVLACTHYPLLRDRLEQLAPWPVVWIDSAPAIARRTATLLSTRPVSSKRGAGHAVLTGAGESISELAPILGDFGLDAVRIEPVAVPA